MSETLALANANLVLPDRVLHGQVTISNGMITQISEGDHIPAGALDCGGGLVLPGLIELHTDNLERHIEPRPAVRWPHFPALLAHDAELASTGITTVFDALRVGSLKTGNGAYSEYARGLADDLLAVRAAGHFRISHFLHLRAEICSATLLDEMAKFGPEDRVGIVSLMDHTPGQRQFRDLDLFKTYVTKKRNFSDAEFRAHVSQRMELREKYGAVHERGAVAEARRYGAVLASHDDTTTKHVAASCANGVSFAEFPTTRAAAQTCRDSGISVMMGAPNLVRGASHSGNVAAEELAKAGLLDILSSDYVPSALLLAAFRLADLWDDLPRAVACVTGTPARVAGLTDRGSITVGQRGDVILVRKTDDTPVLRGVWSRGIRVG